MKILKKILLGLAILFVLMIGAGILVYINLNTVIRKTVTTAGPLALGVPVTLEKVSFRPFRGYLELDNLVVGNPAGCKTPSAFSLGKIIIQMEPATVFSNTIHVQQVLIEKPQITFESDFSKGSNLARIQKHLDDFLGAKKKAEAEKSAETKPAKPGKKVVIDDLQVNGTRLYVSILGIPAAPIPLPSIAMKDIGKDKGGVSMGDAVKQVFSEIMSGISKCVTVTGGAVGDAAKGTGKAVSDGAGSLIKGVKGLFGGTSTSKPAK